MTSPLPRSDLGAGAKTTVFPVSVGLGGALGLLVLLGAVVWAFNLGLLGDS